MKTKLKHEHMHMHMRMHMRTHRHLHAPAHATSACAHTLLDPSGSLLLLTVQKYLHEYLNACNLSLPAFLPF